MPLAHDSPLHTHNAFTASRSTYGAVLRQVQRELREGPHNPTKEIHADAATHRVRKRVAEEAFGPNDLPALDRLGVKVRVAM